MSANVKLRGHIIIVAMLGLAVVLLGKAFGALPDEIDKETYYQRYLAAKAMSDSKRGEANEALANVHDKENQISRHEGEIRGHHNDIGSNQQTISQSESEIANHRSQIQRLREEIPRTEVRLNNLTEEGRRLQNSERDLRARIEVEGTNLQREIERLGQKREELRQVERAQALAQGELHAKKDQLQQAESNEVHTIAEREALRVELANLVREQSVLQSNINMMGERENRLKIALQLQRQVHAENEVRLRQVEQEMAPQRQILERAHQLLETAKQELQTAQTHQRELEVQKKHIGNQLTALDGQLKQIADALARLPERERTLKAHERELQTQIANLGEEIRQGQGRMEPIAAAMKRNAEMIKELAQGEQTPEVQAKMQALRADNERMQVELRALREGLAGKRQAHGEANKQLLVAQQELNSVSQESARLEAEKREVEARRTALNTELQQVERNLLEAINAIARTQQSVTRGQGEVTRAQQNLREGEVQRESVARQVQESGKRLQQAELEAQQASQTLQQSIERLREMARIIAQNETRMRQMEVRLTQLHEQLVQIKNQVRELQRQVGQHATTVQRAREAVVQFEQRVAQQQQNVRALENERSRLLALLEQNEGNRREVEGLLSSLTHELAERQSSIVEFETVIRELRSNVSQLQNLITLRERELAQFKVELKPLQKTFTLADQAAKTVEVITAQKLGHYQERVARYQQYLSAARDLGHKQGHPVGSETGRPLGQAEARRLGALNGLKYGFIVGELDGRWRGLLRGKLVGDETGYHDGLNSKTDYDQAYAIGLELGSHQAESEAERTHVPLGYAERMQETLATVPRAHVVLSNEIAETKRNLEKISVTEFELEKISDETELSAEEIAAAQQIISAINTIILKVEKEIERYQDSRYNFSLAWDAYQGPGVIAVDLSARDCSSVYKKIADYLRACEDSYQNGFKQGAEGSHRQSFGQQYPSEWRANYDHNFAKNKNNLFAASKEEAKLVVYAEARARGVSEIRAKGEEDGKQAGFDQTLPLAQARAFAKGKDKAKQFASTHALVRTTADNSALIISQDPRGTIQGSALALGINLYNAGGAPLASALGRLLITEKSPNLEMKARSRELRELPALHAIELRDVLTVKISEDAVPCEKFWLKGQLIVPGDGVTQEVRLPIFYEGVVKVNPGISTATKFETQPKWRDWGFWPFKWKYRMHEVEAMLTGLRDNVPAGYRVKLSAHDQETEKLINVVRAEANTNAIGRGEKISVKLAYQFKGKAKKKALKFKLQIFYGDKLVDENILSLNAH